MATKTATKVALLSCLSLAAMASILTTATTASAQSTKKTWAPFYGTVEQSNAIQAGFTNAQLFGVEASLERTLRSRGGFQPGFFLGAEFNWLPSSTKIPMKCSSGGIGCNGLPSQKYAMQELDIMSGSYTAGVCAGNVNGFGFCAIGALSFTGVTGMTNGGDRVLASLFDPVYFPGLGLIAKSKYDENNPNQRMGIEYGQISELIEASVSYGEFASLRLGYIGNTSPRNRGVTTNITSDTIKAFLSAALTNSLSNVPLLKAGFVGLAAPIEDAYKTIGLTSVYARRLQTAALPIPGFSPASTLGSVNYWTAHLEQKSIAERFDVLMAFTAAPEKTLQHASVGYHTPFFGVEQLPGESTGERSTKRPEYGYGVSVGYVRIPDLPAFATRGGPRFQFSVNGGVGSFARLSIRMNDPDILAVFPFATNAVNVYLTLLAQ